MLRSTDPALDRELDAQLGEDEDTDEVRAAAPGRWLWVENDGAHEGYRDMEAFPDTPSRPPRTAGWSAPSAGGRGAFRRFRDVLADHLKELAVAPVL